MSSKLENFKRALHNLREIYDYEEPYGNIEMTGMVGLFELCFELSWKAMKEALDESGFSEGKTGSPKLIIKTAYQAEMIDDEEIWLEALAARNNVAHAYNRDIALDIIRKTKAGFCPMFEKLAAELEEKWS